MQVGTAPTSMISTRRQSISRRNAAVRPALEKMLDSAMIGTIGAGPRIGTSTSGIRAPVP
jgi:hypothetical protein